MIEFLNATDFERNRWFFLWFQMLHFKYVCYLSIDFAETEGYTAYKDTYNSEKWQLFLILFPNIIYEKGPMP